MEKFWEKKSPENATANDASIDRGKRKFMVGLAAAGAATMLPDVALSRERVAPPKYEEYDENGENPLYVSIEKFNGLPGNILVICADATESNGSVNHYKMTVETMRTRNALRKKEAVFEISGEKGLYTTFTGNVRDKRESSDGPIHQKTITVVNADNPNFRETVLHALAAQDGKSFSVIQFRGSQGDTPEHSHQDIVHLHKKLAGVKKDIMKNSILFFGGCHGLGFLKNHTPQSPVIVEQETGEAATNSAVLIRLFDELGNMTHDSFRSLYGTFARDYSKRVGSGDIVFPGAPNYREKLKEAQNMYSG